MDTGNALDRALEVLKEQHLDELIVSYTVLGAMERLGSYFRRVSIQHNGHSPYRNAHVRLIVMEKKLHEYMVDQLQAINEFLDDEDAER